MSGLDGGPYGDVGLPFWGSLDPYNKDYSILGSILGYPNFGKLPYGDVGFRFKTLRSAVDGSLTEVVGMEPLNGPVAYQGIF